METLPRDLFFILARFSTAEAMRAARASRTLWEIYKSDAHFWGLYQDIPAYSARLVLRRAPTLAFVVPEYIGRAWHGACMSPCGRWIATEEDTTVTIFDARTGEYMRRLDSLKHGGFSPSGDWFFNINEDRWLVSMEPGSRTEFVCDADAFDASTVYECAMLGERRVITRYATSIVIEDVPSRQSVDEWAISRDVLGYKLQTMGETYAYPSAGYWIIGRGARRDIAHLTCETVGFVTEDRVVTRDRRDYTLRSLPNGEALRTLHWRLAVYPHLGNIYCVYHDYYYACGSTYMQMYTADGVEHTKRTTPIIDSVVGCSNGWLYYHSGRDLYRLRF